MMKLVVSGNEEIKREPRFCRDCKHFRPRERMMSPYVPDLCASPNLMKHNHVTGSEMWLIADFARHNGPCGTTAKFFEKKGEKPRAWWRFWR